MKRENFAMIHVKKQVLKLTEVTIDFNSIKIRSLIKKNRKIINIWKRLK